MDWLGILLQTKNGAVNDGFKKPNVPPYIHKQ